MLGPGDGVMSLEGPEFMNRMQIAVLGVSVAAFAGAYVLFNSGGPTPLRR